MFSYLHMCNIRENDISLYHIMFYADDEHERYVVV